MLALKAKIGALVRRNHVAYIYNAIKRRERGGGARLRAARGGNRPLLKNQSISQHACFLMKTSNASKQFVGGAAHLRRGGGHS